MKNILLGVALGIGAAGVVVAVVLALSGGDEGTVAGTAPTPPPAAAVAPSEAGTAETSDTGGSMAGTSDSVESLARAYCEVEQRDPDDFARQFGTGTQAMDNCIESEIAAAGRECDADRRNDPDDYTRQFGGDDEAAFERCLKYELQSF